jgi:outer membrane murein-binding lipoprotein Lpp
MFLDPIINAIMAPVNFIRTKVFGVENIKGGIQIDVNRVKGSVQELKGMPGELKGKAQAAAGQAQAAKDQAKAGKKKMGLFSKKKVCESCGQKLHPSWDQCPYCGAGGKQANDAPAAAPTPAPSPKMRTMAIDAAAGGTTPIGSAVGWLVPLDGPQTGELFQLKGRCVVGKAPDCDVVLNDPSISSRHAEFIAGRTGFRVNDLGSTNGTYVNDKKVTAHDLVDNDSVRLGRTNFKFKSMN